MTRVFVGDGDRADAPNIVLIFTDGASNINEGLTIPNAIEARQNGAHVIVFGVRCRHMVDIMKHLDVRILNIGSGVG